MIAYIKDKPLTVALMTQVYSFGEVYANHFYRAMHFSAKRGIAIACRLSVCPSVRPSVRL